MKQYSESTLMGMTKKDLVEEVLSAYANVNAAKATVRQQAVNVADWEPVRHGHWLYKHRHRGGLRQYIGKDAFGVTHTITVDMRYECDDPYCSECGRLNDGTSLTYCPKCGAKMDGGADDEV